MIRIAKHNEREAPYTRLNQWLTGLIGMLITTLPAFPLMFLWMIFIQEYRIVDKNGEDHDWACAFITFGAGVLIWIIVILGVNYAL